MQRNARKSFEGLESRRLMAVFAVSNALDAGAGSLREAILQANATAGPDSIQFTIPTNSPAKLELNQPLPPITDPVSIEGASLPGYLAGKRFEIGHSTISFLNYNALDLQAPSTVRGLAITRAVTNQGGRVTGNGIRLSAGSNGSVIEYNYVGLTASQASGSGNSLGINVVSSGNTIRANVIGANTGGGIAVSGSNNVIVGNRIGTDSAGSAARGNAGPGVAFYAGASNNVLGGPLEADRNVVSANTTGVLVDSPLDIVGNVIEGNYIGTTASGMNAMGNNVGIGVNGGRDTVIRRNVVASSTFSGITFGTNKAQNTTLLSNRIGMNAAGSAALLNGDYAINISAGIDGVQVGAAGEGNWLIGGGGATKSIVNHGSTVNSDCINITYRGNVFGILPNGNLAGDTGYALSGGDQVGNIQVGGPGASDGNKFAGPSVAYISFSDGQNNSFQNNWFGLSLDGTAGLGSTQTAVASDNPTAVIGNKFARAVNLLQVNSGAETQIANNTFGLNAEGNAIISGTTTGIGGNVSESGIQGNTFAGMTGTAISVAGNPMITANRFGTDVTGMIGLTTAYGISVLSTGATIGGSSQGAGNLFGKITSTAVNLSDSTGVVVAGNSFGMNADRSVGFNTVYAIRGSALATPTIGGPGSHDGNVFGSLGTAISLDNTGAVIQGNLIGLPSRPVGVGIALEYAGAIRIGGDTAAAGNTFSNITSTAIKFGLGDNDKVTIRRNVFRSVGGLPIDLGNDNALTPNDVLDADVGRQNFPLLLGADSSAGNSTTVTGLINTSAATPLIIDFYAADIANNEARTWLGSKTLLTDNAGGAVFTHTLPFVFGNKYIVATATNIAGFPNGSTSEFSPSVQVVGPVDNVAPVVSGSAFEFETAQQVTLVFDEDLNASSVGANDLVMLNTTTNQPVVPSSVAFDALTRTARFGFAGVLPDGNYTFTLGAGKVTDLAGNGNAVFSGSTHVLAGDLNRDKTVNFDDLLTLAQNYGTSGKTFSQGDSNYDGAVNFDDLLMLAQRYGQSLFSATPILSRSARSSTRDLLA